VDSQTAAAEVGETNTRFTGTLWFWACGRSVVLHRCPDLAHLYSLISTHYCKEMNMSVGRTDFAHVVCVSDRRHLTFSDRHLSHEAMLGCLFLGGMLKLHFAG
jgi:hypothetical protein